MFGDKVKAHYNGYQGRFTSYSGTDGPIKSYELAKEFAEEAGFR